MSKRDMQKTINIWLPMFKQGDDLSHHIENSKSPAEAFDNHAEQMDAVATQLRNIARVIRETETNDFRLVDVCADTHHIDITGPDALTSKLVEDKLGEECEWEDDEWEGEDDWDGVLDEEDDELENDLKDE